MAEWGDYTLLDEAMKLKMANQISGGEQPFLTGSPATGTAIPAIPPELMAGPAKPEATLSEKLMKGMQDFAPLMAQVGTTLMKGRNTLTGAPTETAGSQVGGAIGSMLGTMKMNEAMKKLVAQQLGGGAGVGGGASFTEGQPLGLSSAETVGLTPEQVKGLYSTGLELRASELKRPMDNLKALSESYLHIMTGEAKPAEMEAHLANAQKVYQELASAPVKTIVELMTKVQGMEKVLAEMNEINARIGAMPAETKKKEAETVKTAAETKKLGLEMDPTYTAFKKQLETQYGTKLEEVRRGGKVTLTNPITGKAVMTYDVSAVPETTTKVKEQLHKDITFAAGQVAPWIVPIIESNLATTKDQKQMQNLGQLLSLMKPVGGGEIDVKAVKALAARVPGLAEKFDRAIDAYMTSGGSEQFKGQMVRSIFSEGITPKSAEKPSGGKSVTEKYKPGATTATPPTATPPTAEQVVKQLTGKKPGTYESDNWVVKWDGTKPVSVEPKKATTDVPYNFGTF